MTSHYDVTLHPRPQGSASPARRLARLVRQTDGGGTFTPWCPLRTVERELALQKSQTAGGLVALGLLVHEPLCTCSSRWVGANAVRDQFFASVCLVEIHGLVLERDDVLLEARMLILEASSRVFLHHQMRSRHLICPHFQVWVGICSFGTGPDLRM